VSAEAHGIDAALQLRSAPHYGPGVVPAGRIDGQEPAVVWLTGRSGAGKSTIARALGTELRDRDRSVGMVDGDDLRSGLCSDLGFSATDRNENVRRAAEVARLMSRTGMIVIVSLISPFRDGRAQARSLFEPGEFFESYVDTPLEVTEQRDPKGLYRRARRGKIPQFTGIDSPYEAPDSPEICLHTVGHTPIECAHMVLELLARSGKIVL
jgi:adenylyl-sulfate kinase